MRGVCVMKMRERSEREERRNWERKVSEEVEY